MAVYTVLDREEIEALIAPFGIGPLVEFEGVAAGIENTTYFVTTDQSDFASEEHTEPLRHFVLTVFEELTAAELDFYVEFTTLLQLRGLPVPAPLTDSDGTAIQLVQGKPALLLPKAAGDHPAKPSAEQCREIGIALAELHRVSVDAGLDHPGKRNLQWLGDIADQLQSRVDSADRELLEEVARFQALMRKYPNLPRAVIHGDLFRDNALFQGSRLVAIIDFFSAGNGYLLFDLAVVANDWCSRPDGGLDDGRLQPLLQGYQSQRTVSAEEKRLWNDFLRVAAARFWISRLLARLEPRAEHRAGALTEPRDPTVYRNILVQRIHSPRQWN